MQGSTNTARSHHFAYLKKVPSKVINIGVTVEFTDYLCWIYISNIASRMGVKYLCLIFGISPSTCSVILTKMLRLVVRKLSRNIYTKNSFPTEERIQQFYDALAMREPMARVVVGFMDGLSRHSECTQNGSAPRIVQWLPFRYHGI